MAIARAIELVKTGDISPPWFGDDGFIVGHDAADG
jgi:hypothetical protein